MYLEFRGLRDGVRTLCLTIYFFIVPTGVLKLPYLMDLLSLRLVGAMAARNYVWGLILTVSIRINSDFNSESFSLEPKALAIELSCYQL